MQVDKKVAGGRIRFVVLEALGRAQLRPASSPAVVRDAIFAAAQ